MAKVGHFRHVMGERQESKTVKRIGKNGKGKKTEKVGFGAKKGLNKQNSPSPGKFLVGKNSYQGQKRKEAQDSQGVRVGMQKALCPNTGWEASNNNTR